MTDDLERIAQAFMSEADRRKAVLTEWGSQRNPLVLAPTYQLAKYWLGYAGDEFLTDQGSYARMIVTASNWQTLHGWRGLLVVVVPRRMHLGREWSNVLDLLDHTPGVTTWTERLP